MAICNEMIEGNVVAYSCSLDQGHDGPHMAVENERSVRARARWEAEQEALAHEARQARATLAQFQGPAETTAQRYTENPTPVPLTRQQREEQRAAEQAAQQAQHHPDPVNVETLAVAAQQQPEPRPAVLVANEELIRSGQMHNPFDEACNRRVYGERVITGERCYYCNPAPVLPDPPQDVPVAQPHPGTYPGADAQFFAEHPLPQPTGIAEAAAQMMKDDEALKVREGDQPLPTPTGGEYVQDRIIEKARVLAERGDMPPENFEQIRASMEASKEVGIKRYTTPLQIFNGRDALQDLVDELRDAFVYGNSLMQAREQQREVLLPIVRDALHARWQEISQSGEQATPLEFCTQFAEIALDTLGKAAGPLLSDIV